jgi:hypothetical protein
MPLVEESPVDGISPSDDAGSPPSKKAGGKLLGGASKIGMIVGGSVVGFLALAMIAGFIVFKNRSVVPVADAPIDNDDTSIVYDNVRHNVPRAGKGMR